MWEPGVYFTDPDARQPPTVEFYSFATGNTTRALTIDRELLWNSPGLSSTADGRWILFVQDDQTESDIMLVENFP